jgi:hypothetical protein
MFCQMRPGIFCGCGFAYESCASHEGREIAHECRAVAKAISFTEDPTTMLRLAAFYERRAEEVEKKRTHCPGCIPFSSRLIRRGSTLSDDLELADRQAAWSLNLQ